MIKEKQRPFLLKVGSLIPKNQRKNLLVLLFLMLIGMLLETLGIGLVVPTLALMTQENIAEHYPVLRPMLERLGNPSQTSLIIGGMVALALAYFLKGIFLGLLSFKQTRFIYQLKSLLSERLFENYLRRPYTFHLQRNSAHLIRNMISENNELVDKALTPLSNLTTELSVMFGICALLFLIEPLGTCVLLACFSSCMWIFQRFSRGRIFKWGETRLYHEGLRVQYAQQGLSGVKDVKLLGREAEFIRQYKEHNLSAAEAQQKRAAFEQLPRLWLEVLSVFGFTSLVITMIFQGKEIYTLLPIVGLFAAAAFRALPSANRIMITFHSLAYAAPVVNLMLEELKEDPEISGHGLSASNKPLPLKQILRLEQITFLYPNCTTPALKDLNLTILKGQSVGFIGKSGAGKSTLVDLILGLLPPSTGLVTVDGMNIHHHLRGWQNQIGYVPQSIFLTDDTLRNNIAFGIPKEKIDEQAIKKAVKSAQLEDFCTSLPEGLNTLVGERGIRLSGGQRQRIGIARALYHNPSVLVLDEATSALDTETEKSVMLAIQALQGEKTILIVAHRLSTLRYCNQIFSVEQGCLSCVTDTINLS